jgi:hypothetical protein
MHTTKSFSDFYTNALAQEKLLFETWNDSWLFYKNIPGLCIKMLS